MTTMKIQITPEMRIRLMHAETIEIDVPDTQAEFVGSLEQQRDELLRDMQDVLDMLINQPHAVTAANQAETMLRLSIGTAKYRVKGGVVNHFPDAAKMVPDGWQLVPVEPTEEMVNSGHAAWSDGEDDFQSFAMAYGAMLAAAPKHEGGAS